MTSLAVTVKYDTGSDTLIRLKPEYNFEFSKRISVVIE